MYACPMSHRWHQYGGPSWICQNHTYVFAHCRCLDLLVCLFCICQTQPSAFADKWYQRFFWSSAGFLPKLFLYFSSPISSFWDRRYPHLTELVFLLHCSSIRSEFTHPTHFHSALPTEWWIDRVPDWFPDTGGKKKGWSSVGNVQGSTPIWTNPQFRSSGGGSKLWSCNSGWIATRGESQLGVNCWNKQVVVSLKLETQKI